MDSLLGWPGPTSSVANGTCLPHASLDFAQVHTLWVLSILCSWDTNILTSEGAAKNCGRHTFCIFCVQAHGPTPYQISLIKHKFKDVVVSDANLMKTEIGAARYVSVSKVLGSFTSGSQPS